MLNTALRVRALVLVLAVPGLLLAACGGGTARDGEAPAGETTEPPNSAPGGSDTTSSASPPTTAPGPLGSGEAVTLAFAGDASFESLDQALRRDPEGLLASIAPVLGAADLTVVNLEAALGEGGTRVAKQFAFQVPAQALDALRAAGVDAVTMANNHGMDHGLDGLEESLRIRDETGFPVLGIGRDEDEAYAPWITEVRGQRIGVLAANDVFDSSLQAEWTAGPAKPGLASAKAGDRQERLLAQVRRVRESVDTLAVYLHFGREKDTCPTARQVELATALTGAGADIVVGTHAHRLQGMGYLGDAFVAYGLSNFVFKAPSAEGRRSGVLTVTATGRRIDGYEWTPAILQDTLPVPLQGMAADTERAQMEQLRGCTGLDARPGGGAG